MLLRKRSCPLVPVDRSYPVNYRRLVPADPQFCTLDSCVLRCRPQSSQGTCELSELRYERLNQ